MSADRFDHRDPEVEALVVGRSMEQALAIGSAHPLDVDGDLIACYPDEYREAGPRRATSDVAEMRRRHAERDDLLGVDRPALDVVSVVEGRIAGMKSDLAAQARSQDLPWPPDNGTLNIGIVRDSALDSKNDFKVFMEWTPERIVS